MKSAVAALAVLAAVSAAARPPQHARTASAAPARVYAVRHWSLGDVTRISVAVSSEFTFQSDRLPNPDRLFFDISGARPGLAGKGVHIIPIGDGIARQVRVAETQPGTTRIVVDLEGDVEFTASHLSNPDRLMIELRRRGATPAPLETTVASAKPKAFQPPAPRLRTSFIERLPEAPRMAFSMDQRLPAALLPDLSRLPGPPRKMAAAVARQTAPSLPAATPRTTPRSTATPRSTTTADAAPATPGGLGERSLTRVLGLKLGKIVIDPGHGGHDVGTSGPSGYYEKDLVLDVSRRLGALIERRLGSEVVFTRSDDTFIPLQERTAIANQHHADLFLSVHANSSPAPAASGIETYYLNFTNSKSALDVAARENAGSDRSIYDLESQIKQIALGEKLVESRDFAGRVQTSMMTLARKSNDRSKDRGVRKAPFVVLIGAHMPSVLVEIGFLSNPKDESLMKKAEYRQRIAEALYKGVAQYANSLSHFQVAQQNKAE